MEFLSGFGDYRFLAASSYLTSAVCMMLAVLIITANLKSQRCRLAGLFNLSVSLWAFFYSGSLLWGVGDAGNWAAKLLTSFALLLSCFYTHLVVLLRQKIQASQKIIILNYIYAVGVAVWILVSRDVVDGARSKIDLPSYAHAGSFYFLVPIHTLCNVVYSTILILSGIRSAAGPEKKQFKILLAATTIGFFTGMSSYFLVYDVPIKPILNPLVIINPVLVAYAIIKHRFLDIRKLARNTLIFSLLFVCLLGVVSALLFIFQKALFEKLGLSAATCQFLAIIIALMLYSPLKRGLSVATRKLLYQHTQDAALIFRRLSEDLFKFMEVKKLAEEMTLRVASCLSLERIAFYRRESTQINFKLHSSIGNQQIVKELSEKESLVQYLEYSERFLLNPYGSKDRRVIAGYKNDLVVNTEWLRESALDRLINGEWAVALPIFDKEQLDSFILMGHKKSDASWTQEELGVLESFAHSLSLALVNADAAEAIRTLQRKILASERDASAGALIAGVDHEAKNPLHAASLALSSLDGFLNHPKFLAQQREDQETSVKETMRSVLEDIEEVNHVIQHLSNLAEQKPLRIQEGVALAEVCRKALKTSGVANQIQMRFEFAESFNLTCDPEALQEILSNLIRNASQAGAHELWIQAYRGHSATTIDVKDSGGGIPDSIAQRIFDPFFTTKDRKDEPESAGTGMGLFIVRESMRAMGGDIELMSKDKQGTTFRLLFRGFPKTERGVS